MIIYDILLILQYQVPTTVMDLIVVFCIVSCLYLCLCFCVSVSLSNFWWIKIYIKNKDHDRGGLSGADRKKTSSIYRAAKAGINSTAARLLTLSTVETDRRETNVSEGLDYFAVCCIYQSVFCRPAYNAGRTGQRCGRQFVVECLKGDFCRCDQLMTDQDDGRSSVKRPTAA